MRGSVLFLRARHSIGVLVGFGAFGLLLILAQEFELKWSMFGGSAFPVTIILPLGMACLVVSAEDSESRIAEIQSSRGIAWWHGVVSVAYLVLGSLVIAATVNAGAAGAATYGPATAVRNFLLLSGAGWVFVPVLGGLRSCLVPAVAAGLAVTLFSGATAAPRWNLILLDDTAPDYVTAVVLAVVGIGLMLSSAASAKVPPVID